MSDDRQTATDGNSRTAARQWSAKNTHSKTAHSHQPIWALPDSIQQVLAHYSYKTSYCMLRMTSAMNTNRDDQKYTHLDTESGIHVWIPSIVVRCLVQEMLFCTSKMHQWVNRHPKQQRRVQNKSCKTAKVTDIIMQNKYQNLLSRTIALHASHPRVLPLPTDIYSVLCKTNLQVGLEVGLQ